MSLITRGMDTRDVEMVATEFFRRLVEEERKDDTTARDEAVKATVAVFRIVDRDNELRGRDVAPPVTADDVLAILA